MSVRWTSFTKILLLDTWYPIQASSCKIPDGVSVWSIHGFQWHVRVARVAPWQLCRCRVSRKWSQSIVTLDHILTVAPRSPLRHRCPPWQRTGPSTQHSNVSVWVLSTFWIFVSYHTQYDRKKCLIKIRFHQGFCGICPEQAKLRRHVWIGALSPIFSMGFNR